MQQVGIIFTHCKKLNENIRDVEIYVMLKYKPMEMDLKPFQNGGAPLMPIFNLSLLKW